jgi:hypothetical protein
LGHLRSFLGLGIQTGFQRGRSATCLEIRKQHVPLANGHAGSLAVGRFDPDHQRPPLKLAMSAPVQTGWCSVGLVFIQ